MLSSSPQCLSLTANGIFYELLSHFILKPHGYAIIWDGNTLQEAGEVGNPLGYPQAISLHGEIK